VGLCRSTTASRVSAEKGVGELHPVDVAHDAGGRRSTCQQPLDDQLPVLDSAQDHVPHPRLAHRKTSGPPASSSALEALNAVLVRRAGGPRADCSPPRSGLALSRDGGAGHDLRPESGRCRHGPAGVEQAGDSGEITVTLPKAAAVHEAQPVNLRVNPPARRWDSRWDLLRPPSGHARPASCWRRNWPVATNSTTPEEPP